MSKVSQQLIVTPWVKQTADYSRYLHHTVGGEGETGAVLTIYYTFVYLRSEISSHYHSTHSTDTGDVNTRAPHSQRWPGGLYSNEAVGGDKTMEMMANVWKERRGGRVRPSTVWTHVNPNDILTEKTRTEERWRLLVSLD